MPIQSYRGKTLESQLDPLPLGIRRVKRHRNNMCTFQILGGCQGQRTGVGVTTVSNSLIWEDG